MGTPPMGGSAGCARATDDAPKIIYVDGPIDLNVDDHDVPLTEEDYLRLCNDTEHATFYDPVTRDQTGGGGFFGAYKTAFDPGTWISTPEEQGALQLVVSAGAGAGHL